MPWQERELKPDAGPREYLGYRLRELRQLKGWSLQELGKRTRIDYSYLGKVERAAQLPHRDVIVSCDNALDGGGELPRLFDKIKGGERAMRNLGHVAESVPHVANHVANQPGSLGSGDHIRQPWEEDESETAAVIDDEGRITHVTIPRMAFKQGILAARSGIILPGQAGLAQTSARPIERFQSVRRTLADMDNEFGPLAVIPRAIEQLKVIQQVSKAQRGMDVKDFLRIQTQYADLIGWLHQDSGQFSRAQYWLDRALELAYVSEDSNAVIFIMSRKAQLAADMQDPVTAALIADAAVALDRTQSRQGAIAATYAARGHGLAGEEAEALRSYDQAAEFLANCDEDQTPWGKFFGAAYIGIQRSHSLVDLGRYSEAAEGFRSAIDALPIGFRRDEGVYLAWEAAAHVGNQQPELAVALANESLQIGLETKSSRIITELISLGASLDSWKEMPEVKQFRGRLNATVRRQP